MNATFELVPSRRRGWRALVVAALVSSGAALAGDVRVEDPSARKASQVDVYHGTRVADPYRWLEADSAETRAWIEAENTVTESYFRALADDRAAIDSRVSRLGYTSYSTPEKVRDLYFYLADPENADATVAWVTSSLEDEGRALLDFGSVASAAYTFAGHAVSDDGRWLAYGEATAGSDWECWHVRSVETGDDLPDELSGIRSSVPAWTLDGTAFYYAHYDEPESTTTAPVFEKLYRHRLGTRQDADELVYKRDDDKERSFAPIVTDDGRYLVITVSRGASTKSEVLYQDLEKKGPIVELFSGFEHVWDFLGNVGAVFYFRTDLGASLGRIVKVDLAQRGSLVEVVPECQDPMDGANLVGGKIVATYLKDAHAAVRLFGLAGRAEGEVELPGPGKVEGFSGRLTDDETFYSFTSFTTPETIYRYDFKTCKSTVWRRPHIDFDPTLYETKQVFVSSKDGTKIPLWINGKKGARGPRRTILTGYGGFGTSETPEFSFDAIAWMDMGGVYAVANLRGGGEYGEAWHEAGKRQKKQNVFDDFIACAEWLEGNGVTSPEKLGISGASNGGLLVGACVVQRPELFGAAVADRGVLDLLRYHEFAAGLWWVDEYGSSADPEEFKALRAISPYHNVKAEVRYPPTFITTGTSDDRVVPWHSYKFAAALQAAQAGPAPILLHVEDAVGHDHNATSKEIGLELDQLAFLAHLLK